MKKQNLERAKEDLDLLLAYRKVFGSEEGKQVLEDLKKRYLLRSSMHDNPQRTAFFEGERNVVLLILATINVDEKTLQERINYVNKTTNP